MIAERLILEALTEPQPVQPCGFAQVRSYVRRVKPEAYVKTHDRLRAEVEQRGERVG